MLESTSHKSEACRKVLVVRLGYQLYAIPIECVEEVLPALPIEPVPQCPCFVRGVTLVREQLIPVLAAAERLGLSDYQRPLEPQIVCLRVAGRLVGLEVDEALDIMEVGSGVVLPLAQLMETPGFLKALIEHDGRIFRILDPEQMISGLGIVELEANPMAAE
jgi:purine-binding chemotaxis protein CheW